MIFDILCQVISVSCFILEDPESDTSFGSLFCQIFKEVNHVPHIFFVGFVESINETGEGALSQGHHSTSKKLFQNVQIGTSFLVPRNDVSIIKDQLKI
ncbi:uncharacterized protein CTRU02_210884 [Colletotrichum truncatum]|uniref:Uncharacterized protein n=1 Tax=Colletotrichum truncatum TaxID=5467 RepID=A0ACC3YQ90_COLTU